MSVILILIIASLGLALFFLAGFIWAVKSGQFEDTHTPSMRLLMDDMGQIKPKPIEHNSSPRPPEASAFNTSKT
jgi:cbb3-type cytochrome oxidase maturation protein